MPLISLISGAGNDDGELRSFNKMESEMIPQYALLILSPELPFTKELRRVKSDNFPLPCNLGTAEGILKLQKSKISKRF